MNRCPNRVFDSIILNIIIIFFTKRLVRCMIKLEYLWFTFLICWRSNLILHIAEEFANNNVLYSWISHPIWVLGLYFVKIQWYKVIIQFVLVFVFFKRGWQLLSSTKPTFISNSTWCILGILVLALVSRSGTCDWSFELLFGWNLRLVHSVTSKTQSLLTSFALLSVVSFFIVMVAAIIMFFAFFTTSVFRVVSSCPELLRRSASFEIGELLLTMIDLCLNHISFKCLKSNLNQSLIFFPFSCFHPSSYPFHVDLFLWSWCFHWWLLNDNILPWYDTSHDIQVYLVLILSYYVSVFIRVFRIKINQVFISMLYIFISKIGEKGLTV